jgi:hypothetical protein
MTKLINDASTNDLLAKVLRQWTAVAFDSWNFLCNSEGPPERLASTLLADLPRPEFLYRQSKVGKRNKARFLGLLYSRQS